MYASNKQTKSSAVIISYTVKQCTLKQYSVFSFCLYGSKKEKPKTQTCLYRHQSRSDLEAGRLYSLQFNVKLKQ